MQSDEDISITASGVSPDDGYCIVTCQQLSNNPTAAAAVAAADNS